MGIYLTFYLFILCSALTFLIITGIIFKYKLPVWIHISHLIPSTVALTMFYIFSLNGRSTLEKFPITEPNHLMFRLWVDVFLLVVFSAMLSAAGNFIAILVSLFRQRRWTAPTSIAFISLGISIFALYTAVIRMPSA